MSSTTLPTTSKRPAGMLVIACLILFVDGYDLYILGTVGPSLVNYEPWGATAATIGVLGSATALGMPFGSVFAGWAADRWGRRMPLAVALSWISVSMLAAALAPNLVFFAVVRVCTGLALGALIPLVGVFVADQAPARHRTLHIAVAMSAIGVGGVLAALAGRALLPEVHFQLLFLPGVLPILVVPLIWRFVPAGSPSEGPAGPMIQRNRVLQLLAPDLRRTTILFWVASFLSFALLFSSTVWLPTVMVRAGYDLGSALEFTIAFTVGAVIGNVALAPIADRGHLKVVTLGMFVIAAIALLALSTPQPRPILLVVSALAGVGAQAVQSMIISCMGAFYPPRLRGTGLGVGTGVGRLGAIAGPIYLSVVTSFSDAARAPFFAFIVIAILGAIVISLLPRKLESSDEPAQAAAAEKVA